MNRHQPSRIALVAICGVVLLATVSVLNSPGSDGIPVETAQGQFFSGPDADFDKLVELIQAESEEGWIVIDGSKIDSIDDYQNELGLIIGGGQTIHEPSLLERWWNGILGYVRNGFKSPDPLL